MASDLPESQHPLDYAMPPFSKCGSEKIVGSSIPLDCSDNPIFRVVLNSFGVELSRSTRVGYLSVAVILPRRYCRTDKADQLRSRIANAGSVAIGFSTNRWWSACMPNTTPARVSIKIKARSGSHFQYHSTWRINSGRNRPVARSRLGDRNSRNKCLPSTVCAKLSQLGDRK